MGVLRRILTVRQTALKAPQYSQTHAACAFYRAFHCPVLSCNSSNLHLRSTRSAAKRRDEVSSEPRPARETRSATKQAECVELNLAVTIAVKETCLSEPTISLSCKRQLTDFALLCTNTTVPNETGFVTEFGEHSVQRGK